MDAVDIAHCIIEENATVRQVAKEFGVSMSMVCMAVTM
ncbi:MAG: sporulation transcriptional regulator SpoIIID [Lachnospiraceae bacterium]|nr:sporulation transcriptional regulator SpoIIID [Lachnospiraceae bacterium]